MLHPDVKALTDRIARGPSFEEAMSGLSFNHGHLVLAPPTDAEGVYRLRQIVSALDCIASRAESAIQKVAA